MIEKAGDAERRDRRAFFDDLREEELRVALERDDGEKDILQENENQDKAFSQDNFDEDRLAW